MEMRRSRVYLPHQMWYPVVEKSKVRNKGKKMTWNRKPKKKNVVVVVVVVREKTIM